MCLLEVGLLAVELGQVCCCMSRWWDRHAKELGFLSGFGDSQSGGGVSRSE